MSNDGIFLVVFCLFVCFAITSIEYLHMSDTIHGTVIECNLAPSLSNERALHSNEYIPIICLPQNAFALPKCKET